MSRIALRGLNSTIAVVLLASSLPVFVLAAIGIWLESRGPVFTKSLRLDARGRRFAYLRFRATPATRFGRFMLRGNFDQLPMLLNILGGHFTIVGGEPPHRIAVEEVWLEQIRSVSRVARTFGVDGVLRCLSYMVPRKHREPLVGDLLEDIADRRRAGWGNGRIWIMVLCQLLVMLLEWPAVWKLAISSWLISSLRRWFT